MKIQLKKLFVFAVVLSTSAYVSACAHTKPQQKPEEGPPSQTSETGSGRGESGPTGKATTVQESAAEAEKAAQARAEEATRAEEAKSEAESAAVVEKLEMIHFDFDKFDIKPEYRDVLAKNAEILKAHPSAKVVVEGHCDEVGTQEYNLALGMRRAVATKNYLESLGVSGGELSAISYGEEKPLDPAHTKEAHAKNRRAQFTVK
ncbi:MAG: peptidoglycan-associated lipoprotein Pal [Nitrospinae bacterium]|nr:peptidoglycan-associated lipoprotein Pal [Nitrospinota bacterium]